jgi:flagellar basal body-associated protein FliL
MRIGSVILIFFVALIALGFLLSTTINLSQELQQARTTQQIQDGPLSSRLEALSSNLAITSESIRQVESDIERTKALVADLEKKKLLYEEAITLNRDQVEAVAFLLDQQQKEENKRSFWINVGIGFVVNLLTAVLATYFEYRVGFVRRWLTRKK